MHTHAHTRTRLGMSGTNPRALLSPWHTPQPSGFFGNGHDYLPTSPVTTACTIYQRSEPSNATKKDGEWVLFAVWAMAKEKKKWPLPSLNFGKMFPEMKSWQREGREELHHGILTASGGRWGSRRNPRRDNHTKSSWAWLPRGHSTFTERKATTARRKTLVKASRA